MSKSKLLIIEKPSQVEELIHYCLQTQSCSFDFETTGFEFYREHQQPLITGVSFQPGSSWILPMAHKDSPFKKTWRKHWRTFSREILENRKVVKVAWNFKFEYKWCLRLDTIPKGRLFDAMLAKYLLDEERPHGLKPFVEQFFPMFAGYEQKLRTTEDGDAIKVDWKNTNFIDLCTYCGKDADLTGRGMIIMEPKLIKLGFYSMFRNMMSGVLKVLAECEYRGMPVDRVYLDELVKKYTIKIQEADKKLRNTPALLKYEKTHQKKQLQALIDEVRLDIAQISKSDAPTKDRLIANREAKIKGFIEGKFNGKEKKKLEPINFRSPAQLIGFLYKDRYGLRLPVLKYTKDKKTKKESETPSTDEETLLKLKEKDNTGFLENLLGHREITKLDSTYISGMVPHLDIYNRVHTNYKINGTVTGRLSSVEPNLQNIPRGSTAADIKRMFVPPPGWLWWEVDYSQAELRLIAEVADDKAMIEIFQRNFNPHVATACKMSEHKSLEVYDKAKAILKVAEALPAEELAKPENAEGLKWVKLKKRGKSMNFSVVYQQGAKATAEQLKVDIKEAEQFQKDWYDQFPGIAKWIKKQKRLAHEQEYVYNVFGTKRRLHNINCGNFGLESEAERQAVNAPIQGGSGYYTLFSMVIIREEQMKGNISKDCIMLYTTHDSIGGIIKPSAIPKDIPKIQKICENPQTQKYFNFELKKVKMKTAAEIGVHWANIQDFDPWVNYQKLMEGK